MIFEVLAILVSGEIELHEFDSFPTSLGHHTIY